MNRSVPAGTVEVSRADLINGSVAISIDDQLAAAGVLPT